MVDNLLAAITEGRLLAILLIMLGCYFVRPMVRPIAEELGEIGRHRIRRRWRRRARARSGRAGDCNGGNGAP